MKSVKTKASKIKLIGMDVDGVLTTGEIIVLDNGQEIKFWNVKDGMGFHICKAGGTDIKFVWITGRRSRQVADRAKEMGIDMLFQNCMSKKQAMQEALDRFGLSPEEAAFIGDDIVDVPVFRFVGLSVCPSDATSDVRKEADMVSSLSGGKGVARELIDLVLKSRGLWKSSTSKYLGK